MDLLQPIFADITLALAVVDPDGGLARANRAPGAPGRAAGVVAPAGSLGGAPGGAPASAGSLWQLEDETETRRLAEALAERRRVEDSLRRSEASFRSLIESCPDLVMAHRDPRAVYANPAAVAAPGYRAAAARAA